MAAKAKPALSQFDQARPPADVPDIRDRADKPKRLNVNLTPAEHRLFGDEARDLHLDMTQYFKKVWAYYQKAHKSK